jgi:hypothetical protein
MCIPPGAVDLHVGHSLRMHISPTGTQRGSRVSRLGEASVALRDEQHLLVLSPLTRTLTGAGSVSLGAVLAHRAQAKYPNTSPPEPAGPSYSARVALSCERGHAPGQVLHALQELQLAVTA